MSKVRSVLRTYSAVKNGRQFEYNVEIACPSMRGELIEFLKRELLTREIMCNSVGLLEDTTSVRSFERRWGEIIDGETALVALVRKPNESPEIIGCNMTYKWGSLTEKIDGEAMSKVAEGMGFLREAANIPKRYQVDTWLDAFGLSVSSAWHGRQVGQNLLASREPLCRLLGLRGTFSVFSSEAAHNIAKKVGMETLFEIDGGDLLVSGQRVFSPALAGKMIKGMAVFYS